MEAGNSLAVATGHIKRLIQQDEEVPDLTTLLPRGASGEEPFNPREARNEPPSFIADQILPLPEVLVDQMRGMTVKSFMGLFPTLKRAWMTVDNRLFIWNYETQSDFSVYDGLDQIIVSVAVIKPKPDVFLDEIKHILVLATPVEIVILALMFTGGDINKEMKIIPTKFALPSDNVNMSKIVGTETGRIFLGGADGSLNEVVYQAEEGWFTRKCRKLNYSANRIMGFLPVFTFHSRETPIVDMVVDDTRNILYALHDDGMIQVIDLGMDGSHFRVVCKTKPAEQAPVVASRFPDVKTEAASIVSIFPVPATQSSKIHLVAVTRSGIRMYLGTGTDAHFASGPSTYDKSKRPELLTLVHIRFPPILASETGQALGALPVMGSPQHMASRADVSPVPVRIERASYSDGVLLMTDSRSENVDVLVALGVDPSIFRKNESGRPMQQFREIPFAVKIDGKADAVAEIPLTILAPRSLVHLANDPSLLRSELAMQPHSLPTRKFVCLSPKGLLMLHRSWPVDHLRLLLRGSRAHDTPALRNFKNKYSTEETLVMCLIITLADMSTDKVVADTAKLLFHHYGGQPHVEFQAVLGQDPNQMPSQYSNAVMTEAEILSNGGTIKLSSCHDALYLYLMRLLRPIWKLPIFVNPGGSPFFVDSKIPRDQLEQLQRQLLALKLFITSLNTYGSSDRAPGQSLLRGRPQDLARDKERTSLGAMVDIITRCTELLSLLDLVARSDSARVMSLLSEEARHRAVFPRFHEFICEDSLFTDIIDAVFATAGDDTNARDRMSDFLRARCPSLFKEDDKIRVKAQEAVNQAMLENDPIQRWEKFENALELYCKIPAYLVVKNMLSDVLKTFVFFRFYRGAVELALRCALAIDPDHLGVKYFRTRDESDTKARIAHDKRWAIYNALTPFFNELRHNEVEHVYEMFRQIEHRLGMARPAFAPDQEQALLRDGLSHAREYDDELFHYFMYQFDYRAAADDALVEKETPFIEYWMKNWMENTAVSLHTQSRYFERHGRYAEAARCLLELASLPASEAPSGNPITLELRLEHLTTASHLADAAREQLLKREIEERYSLARAQATILQQLSQSPELCALYSNSQNVLEDLNSQFMSLTELWEVVSKYALHESALELIKISGSRNDMVVRSLWTQIFEKSRDPTTRSHDVDKLLGHVQELTARFSSHSDVVFPLNFIVVELETISYHTVYIGYADKNSSPKIGRVFAALAQGGVPLANLVSAYSDMIWQNSTVDFKLHLVRVLANLMNTWIDLVAKGTLHEGQGRLLRSNRVRASVERLLAELPKFGNEGSILKEQYFRRIEEALR